MRFFVPKFVDHYQSDTYRLVGYSWDGQTLLAHYGDGTSARSTHSSLADLLKPTDVLHGVREVPAQTWVSKRDESASGL